MREDPHQTKHMLLLVKLEIVQLDHPLHIRQFLQKADLAFVTPHGVLVGIFNVDPF